MKGGPQLSQLPPFPPTPQGQSPDNAVPPWSTPPQAAPQPEDVPHPFQQQNPATNTPVDIGQNHPTQTALTSGIRFVTPPACLPEPGKPSIEGSLRYGFKTASSNAGFWFGGVAMFLIAIVGLISIINAINVANMDIRDLFRPPTTTEQIGTYFLNLLYAILGALTGMVFANNALKEIQGTKPTFGDMAKDINFKSAVPVVVIFSVIYSLFSLPFQTPVYSPTTAMASLALFTTASLATMVIVPIIGLCVSPFLLFAMYIALDGNDDIIDCYKQSFALGKQHYGTTLMYSFIIMCFFALSMLPCGLGAFFIFPGIIIATAHFYRIAATPTTTI